MYIRCLMHFSSSFHPFPSPQVSVKIVVYLKALGAFQVLLLGNNKKNAHISDFVKNLIKYF